MREHQRRSRQINARHRALEVGLPPTPVVRARQLQHIRPATKHCVLVRQNVYPAPRERTPRPWPVRVVVVVSEHGPHALRRAQLGESLRARLDVLPKLRRVITRQRYQVRARRVRQTHDAPHLLNRHKPPVVHVRHLRDAEPLEPLRQLTHRHDRLRHLIIPGLHQPAIHHRPRHAHQRRRAHPLQKLSPRQTQFVPHLTATPCA